MTRSRHLPQRTCAACRQVRPKAELLRIVRTPSGRVELDVTGKVAGRGAYLCRRSQCVEQALRHKKLARALGVPVSEPLAEQIRERAAQDAAPAKPLGAGER